MSPSPWRKSTSSAMFPRHISSVIPSSDPRAGARRLPLVRDRGDHPLRGRGLLRSRPAAGRPERPGPAWRRSSRWSISTSTGLPSGSSTFSGARRTATRRRSPPRGRRPRRPRGAGDAGRCFAVAGRRADKSRRSTLGARLGLLPAHAGLCRDDPGVPQAIELVVGDPRAAEPASDAVRGLLSDQICCSIRSMSSSERPKW